ncbi:hypothetical protein Hanom_Chr15g01345511 [Helianthus anomalus]
MSVGCFGSTWVTIQFNIRVSLGSGYFVAISTQFWVQPWCSVQFRVAARVLVTLINNRMVSGQGWSPSTVVNGSQTVNSVRSWVNRSQTQSTRKTR